MNIPDSHCDSTSTSEMARPWKIRKLNSSDEVHTKDYEKEFLIVKKRKIYLCLVCQRQFKQCTSSIVNQQCDSNFRQHYNVFHSYDFGGYAGVERDDLFEKLKSNQIEEEPFGDVEEKLLRVSYQICYQVAGQHRPFEHADFAKIGIFLSPRCVFGDVGARRRFQRLDLSPELVAHRIVELSANIKHRLWKRVKKNVAYSLAFAGTTFADTQVIGIFIRCVDWDFKAKEYLLETVLMRNTTTGNEIFYALSEAIEDSGIYWSNLFSISIAPTILNYTSGLFQLIEEQVKKADAMHNIVKIPSMLNIENLCPKQTRLKNVMDIFVRTLNCIRMQGRDQPQFRHFLTNLERYRESIPWDASDSMHVSWLDMSIVLKRFLPLLDEAIVFLESRRVIRPEFRNPEWLLDCAFLCDLTAHLQNLNTSLEQKNDTIIQFLNQTSAFKLKLSLWIDQLKSRDFSHFPSVEYIVNKESVIKKSINIRSFIEILEQIQGGLNNQTNTDNSTIKKLKIYSTPYEVLSKETDKMYQLEIIDLQCDRNKCAKFRVCGDNLIELYKDLPNSTYPQLRYLAVQVLSTFCSTSICERFFSCIKRCEESNPMMTDLHLSSVLRIMATPTIGPNINKILWQKKREMARRLA